MNIAKNKNKQNLGLYALKNIEIFAHTYALKSIKINLIIRK